MPEGRVDILKAELVELRHIGRRPPALRLQDGQRPELTALDVRYITGRLTEGEIDVIAEHVLNQRRSAAIRHELKRRAGLSQENSRGKFRRAADADRSHGRPAVLALEPGDEAFDVV